MQKQQGHVIHCCIILTIFCLHTFVNSFSFDITTNSLQRRGLQRRSLGYRGQRVVKDFFWPIKRYTSKQETEEVSIADYLTGVVAPLKYIGPYTCLTLCFPDWKKDFTTCDFVLDTGANVNSLNSHLVEQLDLPLIQTMQNVPLVGSTGGGPKCLQKAGNLYRLGDCELVGLPPPKMTFMRNLTAASLPFASPVGAGLLGLSFFYSFPAGVELDWYGTDGDPPTIIFYYGEHFPDELAANMTCIPLTQHLSGVMTLNIDINGTQMPALLDTGAPITVLNQHAAEQAGIQVMDNYPQSKVKITGVDGGKMDLLPSEHPVDISIGDVSLKEGHIFVGNLPALTLMQQMSSDEKAPAAVLGLDFLRRAYRMILRAPAKELWVEELKDQPRCSDIKIHNPLQ